MRKEDIKLIVSDIDGTLINDKDELPSNFIEMVDSLKELGISFAAVSGRGAFSIKSKLNYEADNLYIVSDNGSVTMHGNEIINIKTFEDKEYKDIIKAVQSVDGLVIGAATPETIYLRKGNYDIPEKLLEEFFSGYIVVDDLMDVDSSMIASLSIMCPVSAKESLKNEEIRRIADKYDLIQAGEVWLDAIPKNSNKGIAVEALANHLGFDMSNVIAFGDYNNDIQMIRDVQMGYAMEDATDEVKAVADEVIGSNNDNSVIKKIYELLEL